MADAPSPQTLICIFFKCGDSWAPELFQHAIDNARQNHNIVCQWHGTTIESPRKLYWIIVNNAPSSEATVDALKSSVRALADGEPTALESNMCRPCWDRALQAPITVVLVNDIDDGASGARIESMMARAANMQYRAAGFHEWTQGYSADGRYFFYLGGWDSQQHHMELGASDREEDREFVELSESIIALFSAFRLAHVTFKEERSGGNASSQ